MCAEIDGITSESLDWTRFRLETIYTAKKTYELKGVGIGLFILTSLIMSSWATVEEASRAERTDFLSLLG